MKHKRPPIPVIVVVLLAILVGAYFLIREGRQADAGSLSASGTIEAVEITISPELAGKVVEVLVEEGDTVQTGDVLFRQDDALLQAQRDLSVSNLEAAQAAAGTAEAALATAQAQHDLTLGAARAESASARMTSWRLPAPADFDQPNWYFTQEEQIAAAQAEVDASEGALSVAKEKVTDLEQTAAGADFTAAEKRLAEARAGFLVARDVRDRAYLSTDKDLHDAAQDGYDDAGDELDAAQQAYDDLLDTETAQDILTARAELAIAQEHYDAAQDRLLALQTGVYSPRVVGAEAALRQAEAVVAQAQTAVEQVEAQVALIDVQIEKLTVRAPNDGVILTRSIEPGEVITPGAAALTLGRLDSLTITVYVPEDRYGEISLGQTAGVSVDSFPGEVFTATVVHIAGQAEFTPRNVQTVESRKTTVFAIRLRVEDPEGKLKPGMPADVTFR